MNMKMWLVAYNKPTKEWSSGGSLDEYPLQHWDRYQVQAKDRDEAVRVGKQMRAKQRSLTEAQHALLRSLLEEVQSDEHPLRVSIEISADEVKAGKSLATKGLLVPHDDDVRQVKLTVAAFNFALQKEGAKP